MTFVVLHVWKRRGGPLCEQQEKGGRRHPLQGATAPSWKSTGARHGMLAKGPSELRQKFQAGETPANSDVPVLGSKECKSRAALDGCLS